MVFVKDVLDLLAVGNDGIIGKFDKAASKTECLDCMCVVVVVVVGGSM
jgi:hypothetical protein